VLQEVQHSRISGRRGVAFCSSKIQKDEVPMKYERADALADQIVAFHKNGKLPTPFCVKDIRKIFQDQFSENHIRTVLSNYCSETGDEVHRGQKARFRRESRGRYVSI
jgi:DNA-binding transcriptional MocR family regulator